MNVGNVSNVSFGRCKSVLKTEWLRGGMPGVTKGLYGNRLTPNNVSIEHLVPRNPKARLNGRPVRRGRNVLDNFALATKQANNARGNDPLRDHLTREQADEYLKQFKGVKTPIFDGDSYVKRVGKTIDRLLK